MGFFTLQEIRAISNKISCDVFVQNHKITNEDSELFRYEDPAKREREVEPEPDLQVFIIKMRKPEELAQEYRDELKRCKAKKQGRKAASQN